MHLELHKKYEEFIDDQNTGNELVDTITASTKVLTSGKVVGKPIKNNAKQEWIQISKNNYRKDNRGHIIEVAKEQGVDNVKGKNKD